jgi:hypothetical protein
MMANATEILALAARVEGASGANYALFLEIYDALRPGERASRFAKLTAEGPYKGRLGPADMDGYVQPLGGDPTASLDAAMTLVPEGIGGEPLAIMLRCSWRGIGTVKLLDTLGGQEWGATAATAALALTAAALRAIAAGEG